MEHSFSQVPRANIPRSSFNRSHGLKTTFDADYLIPILVDEVVPGDTFNVNCNFVARLATPLYPIMDNLYLETFFFFVPNRIVWENWEKFCGAQDNPSDSISYTVPVCTGGTTAGGEGTIWDYFGLPLDDGSGGTHVDSDDLTTSCLPFRAYALIYNEWFRDQNLQDDWLVDLDDGPDTFAAGQLNSTANRIPYQLFKRGKRHDYFTSCLPAPQRGTAPTVSLGTTAPVTGLAWGDTQSVVGAAADNPMRETAGDDTWVYSAGGASYPLDVEVDTLGASTTSSPMIYADLSSAAGMDINAIRLAFQTQRLLERDARSGTRYNETILAHFGVTVPDFRVQRPEFLGGGSSPVAINQVAQTSGQPTPAANDKLGELAAYGVVSGSHGFTKSFVEHGIVMGLANIRSDITYCQGQERFWAKQTRYDFYYPVLATIGEQSVLNKEIYFEKAGTPEGVFGYQERYAEMRYKPSRLTGLFSVDAAGTLEAWHLAEEFTSAPSLDTSFIQSNTGTPLDRAIAISTEPHMIADFYFDMKCARPMPLYGVPGNLDHF